MIDEIEEEDALDDEDAWSVGVFGDGGMGRQRGGNGPNRESDNEGRSYNRSEFISRGIAVLRTGDQTAPV